MIEWNTISVYYGILRYRKVLLNILIYYSNIAILINYWNLTSTFILVLCFAYSAAFFET